MHLIPHSWSHLHILISVFPTVGFLFVLGVYAAGLRTGNDFVRRVCLAMFAGLGLLSVPILVSGFGSMAALSGNPRFAERRDRDSLRLGTGGHRRSCDQRGSRRL